MNRRQLLSGTLSGMVAAIAAKVGVGKGPLARKQAEYKQFLIEQAGPITVVLPHVPPERAIWLRNNGTEPINVVNDGQGWRVAAGETYGFSMDRIDVEQIGPGMWDVACHYTPANLPL